MSAKNSSAKRVAKFKNLDSKTQELLREAVEARNFAYCPYSKFQVGASVLCDDGTIYRGCNIENSAYTVGICAERTALAKAISEGKQRFKTVAVIGYQEKFFTTPCGACRQFMSEFGNISVYIAKPELDDVLVTDLEELLPHQFQTMSNHTF
ncbi:hypothetical protein MTP99_018522 [Tenebrio molitor]|jgi:cytidine deaminase|uniref:cytidine deaminase-like n=1 Tax=Tenebrio molitor TaxID=7067 RepID=UPI001C3ADE21|nr:hypothetical protein MTP99_018522 [Tenebrio molitor]CAH1377104.1 unnamed protein product [Tenebrio molitor]